MDEAERTMQALHDAILDALFNGGVLRKRRSSDCLVIRPTAIRKASVQNSRN